jgi:hypothetical protein
MKTKIIKVKDYNSTAEPYEVMLYQQSDGTYCVQVKNYAPDCWKSKQNALAYIKWFKDNKIVISE